MRCWETRKGPAVSRYRHHLIALSGYLALTALLTYPLIREFSRAIPGDGFDGWQNVWNIWWVKRALLVDGANPYFTPLLDYPAGVYLYFHTLNIFNGLTFLPVTLNAGNLVAYNVAGAFSFVVGGYGAYLLALRVMRPCGGAVPAQRILTRLAAFLGGCVFVFSPYHMAHLMGHMQLISLEWLPFAALAVAAAGMAAGDVDGRTLAVFALSALTVLLVLVTMRRLFILGRANPWYLVFYPLAVVLVLWFEAGAMMRALGLGRVTWRGTSYKGGKVVGGAGGGK